MATDLGQALAVAVRAARAAGAIQLAALSSDLRIEHKGRFDLVTEVDRRCERAMLEILRGAFPAVGLLGEELTRESLDAEEVFLIDPLDGTTNFTHGYPVFGSTVALRRQGETWLGVVYDPLRDELFAALRGQGATLNGRPIRVSRIAKLEHCILATGFPYDRTEQPETNLERFAALTMKTQGVRRSGSAALDLCHTACGRLDGYWELRVMPWDVCAGALLCEEAGGRVSDLAGGPFDGSGRETVATNGLLHDELIAALGPAAPRGVDPV